MCEGCTPRMKVNKMSCKKADLSNNVCYVLKITAEKATWHGVFGNQKALDLIPSFSTFYLCDIEHPKIDFIKNRISVMWLF